MSPAVSTPPTSADEPAGTSLHPSQCLIRLVSVTGGSELCSRMVAPSVTIREIWDSEAMAPADLHVACSCLLSFHVVILYGVLP